MYLQPLSRAYTFLSLFFFNVCCTSAALATRIFGGRHFSEKEASFISEANEGKKKEAAVVV